MLQPHVIFMCEKKSMYFCFDRTIGPVSPTWDRWFEGPQDSKGCCRCWILWWTML